LTAKRTELETEAKEWKARAEAKATITQELEEQTQRLASEKQDLELLITRYTLNSQ